MTPTEPPTPDPPVGSSGLGPVLTVPNVVSFVRLLCIPLFLVVLFGMDSRVGAAALLAGLGASDWVDGYLARRLDQHSDLGKILDPTADRLMFLVAVVAMIVDGSVPVWFAVMSLVREGVVGLAAVVFGLLGARRIDVTWWGKTATFGLMFAFPLFLLGSASIAGADGYTTAAWIIGIPSLALSYYVVGEYVPLALGALREGRAARAGARAP